MVLKRILKKWCGMWPWLISFRTQAQDGIAWTQSSLFLLRTHLGATWTTEQLLYSKLLPYFRELVINNQTEVCARNHIWCKPRFFAEFVWRGRKTHQKNYRLLLSTLRNKPVNFRVGSTDINPYPTAFPYGNGMVLHFYQQQESSTTKTAHKVINKGLKAYV